MCRLIDADALYEKTAEREGLVRERVFNINPTLPYSTSVNPAYTQYFGQLCECTNLKHMIADAPTIELPHWIPCSERLPLTYEGNIPVVETYIVTVSVDGVLFVDTAYSFGTYIDGFWDTVVDWDEGNDVHVLAWMPLPTPYKGGQDD